VKVGRFTVTLLFFTTPEVNPAASEIKFPKALKDPFKTSDIHHLEVHPTFIELLSIQTKNRGIHREQGCLCKNDVMQACHLTKK